MASKSGNRRERRQISVCCRFSLTSYRPNNRPGKGNAMIATICRVELVEEDVEIPDSCPHCGASFITKEDKNLVEWRVEDTAVATTAEEDADVDDDISETGELVFITGYQCRVCKNMIVEPDIQTIEEDAEVIDVG
jgi:hypothetical protein